MIHRHMLVLVTALLTTVAACERDPSRLRNRGADVHCPSAEPHAYIYTLVDEVHSAPKLDEGGVPVPHVSQASLAKATADGCVDQPDRTSTLFYCCPSR
jgi:hypothetical protein